MFNCGFGFTNDQIWARQNKRSQNWYFEVENSRYQSPACFLVQDFVYSNESLGEIIFHIFLAEKVTLCI